MSALPTTMDLRPGQLFSRRAGASPLCFAVTAGRVWLTREGDPEDVVLGAGSSRCVAGRGLVVVQALGAAQVTLSGQTVGRLQEGVSRARSAVAQRGGGLVWLALAAVYLIWGSTYLAMRVALESFPPFLLAGVRFSIAGAALYAGLRAFGAPRPTREEVLASAPIGMLLLGGGNGLVAVGQQWVSTGLAAVIVATMPLWTAVFSALWGERSTRLEWVGLAIGFLGALSLQLGGELDGLGRGAMVILLAPVCWALGSVWGKRRAQPQGAMAAAVQMLTGGPFMLLIAVALGEKMDAAPSVRSLGALGYQIVLGSLVAFSAYGYLLRKARPAVATSYAYVNPIIALALGSVVLGEPLHAMTGVAGALIVAGIAVVSYAGTKRRRVA